MPLAERFHGAHGQNPDTEGIVLDHGHRYELFTDVFFLGRHSAVYRRLARLSGAGPGQRVLDVGCGTGYLTRRLAPLVGPSGRVTGVDASAGMLAQAREKAPANCVFERGFAERLEAYPDGSFDVVTSALMLHHLPAELRLPALNAMHRVLRPGGRLLIAEFLPPSSKVGRHVIGALTGPAMVEDQRPVLPGLISGAGFGQLETGDVRPWTTYVRAVREE